MARLAIVGGGLIGAEVASTARDSASGRPSSRPGRRLSRGRSAVRWGGFLPSAGDSGAAVRTGAHVARRTATAGRLTALGFDDGTSLACDRCWSRSGPSRYTARDRSSALAPDGGIATDDCGRTSAPGVFACGDVASWHRQGSAPASAPRTGRARQTRRQSSPVPSSASGRRPIDVPLYAWSDQFGLRLQHISTGGAGSTSRSSSAPRFRGALSGSGRDPARGARGQPAASRRRFAPRLGRPAGLGIGCVDEPAAAPSRPGPAIGCLAIGGAVAAQMLRAAGPRRPAE